VFVEVRGESGDAGRCLDWRRRGDERIRRTDQVGMNRGWAVGIRQATRNRDAAKPLAGGDDKMTVIWLLLGGLTKWERGQPWLDVGRNRWSG
jgi:hypothetical protein